MSHRQNICKLHVFTLVNSIEYLSFEGGCIQNTYNTTVRRCQIQVFLMKCP